MRLRTHDASDTPWPHRLLAGTQEFFGHDGMFRFARDRHSMATRLRKRVTDVHKSMIFQRCDQEASAR